MSPRYFLPILLALPFAFAAFAEEKAPEEVFLEPETAGPDFAIQGEYVGDNCGAQVIALGGGKFHIVGWSKGLPGTVENAEKKIEVDAQRDGEKAMFDGSGWKGKIEAGQLIGTNEEGRTLELRHTLRESPTLGAKPPAGAIVLFDGTNADAWTNGHVDERKLLGGGTKSVQKFGDFTLHVEFRTPFKPAARGQARGNSGVYLQDRYEVQVLDSFGLNGENNECGGIYTKVKPRVNACFPPLSWQTYDIDFEAAHFDAEGKKARNAVATVRHNGILIHDHVEISGSTGGGQPEKADPGPIQLQGHGNPVFYRNIWIVEKK
ncbi:MAG: DUF1080 domain-containing protein [Chthoniobacter sp.]|uniref:3-keto-disaccharide hydrolase n=1 Tax=Chthoniobacter sp. TaxID=2510640 RepID=UPI0032A68FAA